MAEITAEEARKGIADEVASGNLFPGCAFLELRLPQIEREGITPYITGIKKQQSDSKALLDFVMNHGEPRLRQFEPYCRKTGSLCVVMESPVVSMQTTGCMYQPLAITLMNSNRIERCEKRELPSNSMLGTEDLYQFVLEGIARAIINHQ